MSAATQLTALERADLVRLAQQMPELEYMFRHVLIQDAAYGSLLKSSRRDLHAAIGKALEDLYPGRGDELSPVLARHFEEANQPDRALRYYAQAGLQAQARHASAEAVMHFECALHMIESMDGAALPDGVSLTAIYAGLGRALEMTGRYADADRTYVTLDDIARARADRAMELAALTAHATIHSAPTALFDAGMSRTLSARALQLARELGDRAAEARTCWNLLLAARFSGDLPAALSNGERAVALARELNLQELLAFTLNDLAPVYAQLGDGPRATATTVEACDRFRALGNLPMLCDSLNNLAEGDMLNGEFERALTLTREAHDIARAIGNLWGESYSEAHLAFLSIERGEMAEGLRAIEASVRLGRAAGFAVADMFGGLRATILAILGDASGAHVVAAAGLHVVEERLPAYRNVAQALVGWTLALTGHVAEGRPLVRESEAALFDGDAGVLPTVLEKLGDFALMDGDAPRVLSAGQRALEIGERLSMRILLPVGYLYEGHALRLMGRHVEAYEALLRGYDLARKSGSLRMRLPIALALATVADVLGRPDEAAVHRRAARDVATFIADHAPEELRATFLAQPHIRALFA